MRSIPREFSHRAAQAARVFIPAAVLVLAGCGHEPAPPLPQLRIDPQRVTVVGLSSGALMATQTHLAWSDRFAGVAIIAGGPYGCAGGSLKTALGPCISGQPYVPDVERLAAKVRARADGGDLAPLAGLAGDRVFALHGQEDAIVDGRVSAASLALYAQLEPDAPGMIRHWDGDRRFGHVMPTLDVGSDCIAGGGAYLGNCGIDGAALALDALYGPAPGEASQPAGELRRFDQDALLPEDGDAQLASDGWLYVPAACAAGEACGAVIVFHGCEQNAEKVGEAFVRDAGFNRWADVRGLVVLYPQTRSSYLPLNPKACWDWWGYTGPDYDTRRGAQQRWLAAAMAALGAPLE